MEFPNLEDTRGPNYLRTGYLRLDYFMGGGIAVGDLTEIHAHEHYLRKIAAALLASNCHREMAIACVHTEARHLPTTTNEPGMIFANSAASLLLEVRKALSRTALVVIWVGTKPDRIAEFAALNRELLLLAWIAAATRTAIILCASAPVYSFGRTFVDLQPDPRDANQVYFRISRSRSFSMSLSWNDSPELSSDSQPNT